jgi:hypothetical protein
MTRPARVRCLLRRWLFDLAALVSELGGRRNPADLEQIDSLCCLTRRAFGRNARRPSSHREFRNSASQHKISLIPRSGRRVRERATYAEALTAVLLAARKIGNDCAAFCARSSVGSHDEARFIADFEAQRSPLSFV